MTRCIPFFKEAVHVGEGDGTESMNAMSSSIMKGTMGEPVMSVSVSHVDDS